MTHPSPGFDPPPLGPADVYVYALGNGALFVLDAAGRDRLAPLAGALEAAQRAAEAGGQVLVAQDDGALAASAIDALRTRGLALVEVPDAPVPQVWKNGGDALMEAATNGNHALLDDLLARGADVHRQDISGSTALHHAAVHGDVHAVEAIVAAGADLERTNRDGLTPLDLARATREEEAAERLIELGASVDRQGGPSIRFRKTHAFAVWVVALLPVAVFVTVVGVLWPPSLVDAAIVVAVMAVMAWALPPRPFWTGGVPRRIDGDRLTLRTFPWGTRVVDLADVTAGALAGMGRNRAHGGRILLLAHPAGTATTPRLLLRMGVVEREAEAIGDRFPAVIAVPMSGAHRDEVILAVGNRLSALGVDLSVNLRKQLAEIREAARSA